MRPLSRHLLPLAATVAMLGSLAAVPVVPAADALALVERPGAGIVQHETGEGPATYIVVHEGPPLALYDGSLPGLAATAPSATGAVDLDVDTAASQAYLEFLDVAHERLVAAMSRTLGTDVTPAFRYRTALNGLAVELSPAQAVEVSRLPGVARVIRETPRYLTTDNGPRWIGADDVWAGSDGTTAPTGTGKGKGNAGGNGKGNGNGKGKGKGGSGGTDVVALPGYEGTLGAGVVVGVIDTGINHDHPSFAAIGGDGYEHTNPRDRYYGFCAVAGTPLTGACNDKLIGIYDFTGTGPEDDHSHGSHTASTAAGNVVDATLVAPTVTFTRDLSGVAPHANIIAYKGCSASIVGCQLPGLVKAIDQATFDEVDVINYSIGGGSTDPWTDPDALAFLGARAAGVFVATSASNDGPAPSTVGSPGDAPWVLTVGASTHDRKLFNALTGLSSSHGTLADIEGASLTADLPQAPIVWAGDHGNALCGEGTDPINPDNPWEGETPFTGKIVICDRGTYGRVAKAEVVAEAGAAGYVLANDEASGDSLTGDAYPIPGVHISFDDGEILKAWMVQGGDPVAAILGTTFDENPEHADIMASFSSRGPNSADADILKPDITAPGVDILAAYASWGPSQIPGVGPIGPQVGPVPTDTEPEYGVMSGTSMSSPHLAGTAALLTSLRPTWSPDQIKAALMTTAFDGSVLDGDEVRGIVKEDGVTPTDPFDRGSGRVAVDQAAFAPLVLDETPENYLMANPLFGGQPGNLNVPSLAESACDLCSWTRTLTNTSGVELTWDVVAELGDAGIEVSPTSFTLADGESQTLEVTADATGLVGAMWRFGTLQLVPRAAAPTSSLPIAVKPANPEPGEGGAPAQEPATGSVVVPAPGAGVVLVDGVTQTYFEFTVKDGFDNARLTGHADVLPAGDIDLYLQKLEGDTWSGDLAEGTSPDLRQETVSYVAPAPGQYRIRIHNWAGGPTRVEMTVTFYNASDEPGVAEGGDQPAGWMARLL